MKKSLKPLGSEPLLSASGNVVKLGEDLDMAMIFITDVFTHNISKDFDNAAAVFEGIYTAIQHHPGLKPAAGALQRIVSCGYVFNRLHLMKSADNAAKWLWDYYDESRGLSLEKAVVRLEGLHTFLKTDPRFKRFGCAIEEMVKGYRDMHRLCQSTEAALNAKG